jgi:hypothetical protein
MVEDLKRGGDDAQDRKERKMGKWDPKRTVLPSGPTERNQQCEHRGHHDQQGEQVSSD